VLSVSSINPFRVFLRHRNFRLFLIGQTLSLIGTWMQSMALGWLALELTNSAFLVGLVATASSIPILVFTMHAGAVVDRSDKLKLVKFAQVAFLADATLLWWLTYTHRINIVSLTALAFVSGCISSVEIPARQSMFIDLVGREDLPDAIALNSSGFNLARVVGPGLAAAVIARLGIAWCFALNAASFVTVLIGLFMIHLPKWAPHPNPVTPWEGVQQALRYMRDTPTVRALMSMVTVYSILGVPLIAMMPVVARDMFGLGPAGYGLLMSCLGLGGLTGALALAAVGYRVSRIKLLIAASTTWPLLLLAFAFTRVPWVAYRHRMHDDPQWRNLEWPAAEYRAGSPARTDDGRVRTRRRRVGDRRWRLRRRNGCRPGRRVGRHRRSGGTHAGVRHVGVLPQTGVESTVGLTV
jgi:MFS family permease